MNLSFVAPLVEFMRHNLLKLTAVLLGLQAVVGGYSGWRYYQFRQTAEYAFLQIKDSLHPAKPTDLALLVNFDAISLPLAKAVAQHYPFLKPGPNQIRDLSDMIQVGLLKQMRVKEEPIKEETDELARLKSPLYVLPPNFFTQLSANIALQSATETSALVSAQIRHPVLDKPFSLLLRLDKTTEGWKLDDLINAQDLVRQFREAQKARMVAQRQLLLDKNAQIKKRIEDTFPIKSCTASAGLLSDGQTLLVVVDVEAKNIGLAPINNMDLSARILAPDGTELLQRYLNAVQPTFPGETYNRNWTIEVDGSSSLGKSIQNARKLTCEAFWKTLGMGNGEILHFALAPEQLEEFQ